MIWRYLPTALSNLQVMFGCSHLFLPASFVRRVSALPSDASLHLPINLLPRSDHAVYCSTANSACACARLPEYDRVEGMAALLVSQSLCHFLVKPVLLLSRRKTCLLPQAN
jgi:hypothetical protein